MNRTFASCSASVVALVLGAACASATTSVPAPGNSTQDSAVVLDAAAMEADAAEAPGEDAGVPVPFALSSAEIVAGAPFPAAHTCTGANTSPSFAWTPGPEGTLSYALVLNDTSISFLHSVTYDIPVDVLALPAKMDATYAPSAPAGAHQTKN